MKLKNLRQYQIFALCLTLLLGGVPAGRTQGVGALFGTKSPVKAAKTTKTKNGESPTPPAEPKIVDAQSAALDGQVKALQENLADAQRNLAAVRADMSTATLAIMGGTSEEYIQRAQMARALVYEYERNIEGINRLRKLRQDRLDPTEEAVQLQTFIKQKNYTIDTVDELRGQIQDVQIKISSAEGRRTITENGLEQARADLKEAGVRIRQTQEQLESAKSKSEESRLHWQLDQAQLAERLARVRQAAYETSRASQDEDLTGQRRVLGLLERKLSIAAASAPFTQKDLDAKLEKLQENLTRLLAEQDKMGVERARTTQALEEARAKQRQERDRITAASATTLKLTATATATATPASGSANSTAGLGGAGIAPEMTPAAKAAAAVAALSEKEAAKLAQLQAAVDVAKEQADTATAAYTMLRLLIQLTDREQELWSARLRDTNPNKPEQRAEIDRLIGEGLDKTAQYKLYIQTTADVTASQVGAAQTRVEGLKAGDVAGLKAAQTVLASLQARADYYRRTMEQTRHTERLLQSWQAEVQERLSNLSLGERAKTWARKAGAWLASFWQLEIFAVEETTADGKQVTRSITVGKLVSALGMLLVGIWICHRVADVVRRIVRRRFRARDNAARLLYKFIFFSGLIVVILFTFVALKIPLTIFAFLGGALAIGIGFGAQNLINNFISGLILIFERPIKVGDIVEVDGQCGKVVTIGGRCSRIKRFDGIDILIPNSSFLEKNVVNRTLSDVLLRQTIRVGVDYGSSTREVMRLIHRSVEEHGLILKEPASVVVFEDFGDHAMLFAAYFWIEQRDGVDARVVASDVRCRIEKLFGEAGISMPYPQRDIHLDTVSPIQVSLTAGPEVMKGTHGVRD